MRRAWVGLGLLGVALLIPFQEPLTLTLGVLALLGFVALGVYLIASPEFLRGDAGEDQEGQAGATARGPGPNGTA